MKMSFAIELTVDLGQHDTEAGIEERVTQAIVDAVGVRETVKLEISRSRTPLVIVPQWRESDDFLVLKVSDPDSGATWTSRYPMDEAMVCDGEIYWDYVEPREAAKRAFRALSQPEVEE